MATLYAGFDLARVGSMALVLTDETVTGVTVTVPVNTYCHLTLASIMGAGKYTALAAALQTALQAASPTHAYTCSYSASTRRYTIAKTGASMTLDFTAAAGVRLAQALGMSDGNVAIISGTGYAVVLGGAASIVSNVVPYYSVPLARPNPAGWSRPAEVKGFVKRSDSVNGNRFSVNPITIQQVVSFSTLYMPLANVFIEEADTAEPWTIKHLCQHARGHEPILASFTVGDFVIKLGEDDGAFHADLRNVSFMQNPDYHGLWNVKFTNALYLGEL